MKIFDKVRSLFQSNRLDVSGRFELLREAVWGTMSEFYVAREIKTGEIVGLKLLDVDKTDTFESRFKSLGKPSEGELLCKLNHPRIVKGLEHGLTNKGQQYIVMEYLDGPGLNKLVLDKSDLLAERRAQLIQQMAEAIDAVHKAGFVHRDICPRNFICSKDLSELKIIDFGLALPDEKPFHQPGNRTGTPQYMAPEIVRRRPTDKRLDVFAFGVSAYQLCTFQFPWPGEDLTGKAALAHDTITPTPIFEHCPKLDRSLGEAIMKCLAASPADRPSDMQHFLRLTRS